MARGLRVQAAAVIAAVATVPASSACMSSQMRFCAAS